MPFSYQNIHSHILPRWISWKKAREYLWFLATAKSWFNYHSTNPQYKNQSSVCHVRGIFIPGVRHHDSRREWMWTKKRGRVALNMLVPKHPAKSNRLPAKSWSVWHSSSNFFNARTAVMSTNETGFMSRTITDVNGRLTGTETSHFPFEATLPHFGATEMWLTSRDSSNVTFWHNSRVWLSKVSSVPSPSLESLVALTDCKEVVRGRAERWRSRRSSFLTLFRQISALAKYNGVQIRSTVTFGMDLTCIEWKRFNLFNHHFRREIIPNFGRFRNAFSERALFAC